MRNALLIPLYLIGMIAALVLGGCEASSQTGLDDAGASAQGNPASLVRGPEQAAAYQGAQPSQIALDEQLSFTTPGAGAVVAFGELRLWSPKDVTAESITYTPEPADGEPAVKVRGLRANISDVAQVRADKYRRAMTAIQGMTEAEARRRIEQMEAAGEISSDVADVLVQSVIPNL